MKKSLSFKDILDASIINLKTGAIISTTDILIALTITLFCAAIIHWTYRLTFQGVLYQKSFNISLVMASLITTVIIMVISGNLILSLGMVGALSIVRFRTAVKDPLDIIFMFWSIAVGIANGVANFKIAVTGSLFLAGVMFVASRMKFVSAPFLLIIKYQTGAEEAIGKVLSAKTRKYRIKTKTVKSGFVELTAEVRLRENERELLTALDGNEQVKEVALLSYSNDISGN